jgi:hypothetical protein
VTRIALIVLDTLRKDAFDRHFDWLPGRRFEHAFSTANWTTPAHASLFTGWYASEVGVHAEPLPPDGGRQRKLEHSAFADRIERYDGPLHGYVGPPDYYGRESLDGFEETGRSTVDDPPERLQTLLTEREVRTVEEDTEVPDEISDQLEHLGYA